MPSRYELGCLSFLNGIVMLLDLEGDVESFPFWAQSC